ncbi:eukaryotic translation initiation factor eIF2A-domain-containing protein [Phlyctochytrium arcticum]|nr:eukaryotic translation initiation factor eIF2A-domain-containing protein [Phlyctochytrium arcticum]
MAPAVEEPYTEEDIANIDFSDLEENFKVDLPSTFDNVVVVDNVPIVGETKRELLLRAIRKLFRDMGEIKDIEMPVDPATGKSKGFLFIEFDSPDSAALAVRQANGHRMDKQHVLAVNRFDDIEKYSNIEDTYTEPEPEQFEEKEHLKSWLTDSRARDQWVMMKGDEVSIYWNNKSDQPDLVHSRANWSDMYVAWSPRGTYLATFHKQGIALWGGPSWSKIVRFPHTNVKLIDFSPNERYITTWSHEPFVTPTGEYHHIAIWDIVTGRQLRSFALDSQTGSSEGRQGGTMKIDWPMFKWSHDDKYVARMVDNMISVYETPGMGLLDKKSFKIENLKTFEWSPTDHMISYWTPEIGNIPARVTLIRVPSREVIRTKNLFGVIDCKLYWQSGGEYLLVRVDRAKTKKSTSTNFEIFRLSEKDVPVDVMEVDSGSEVLNVFWEPKGHRFAVLSQESQRTTVGFYHMVSSATSGKKGGPSVTDVAQGVKLDKTADANGANQVVWSPKGRFCVVASVRSSQGELQFWDAEDAILMATGDHYMCTDLEWDPTGRFVTSSVSWWRIQSDTGFMMWTFTGQLLTKQTVPTFKQLLWRPRPPSLLSEEEQKKIKKNLKEYSKKFEEEDAAQSKAVNKEVLEKRLKLWREWNEYVQRVRDDYEKSNKARFEIWGFDPEQEDEAVEGIEEWVEELIEETEEIVN